MRPSLNNSFIRKLFNLRRRSKRAKGNKIKRRRKKKARRMKRSDLSQKGTNINGCKQYFCLIFYLFSSYWLYLFCIYHLAHWQISKSMDWSALEGSLTLLLKSLMSKVSLDISTFHIEMMESRMGFGILSQFFPIFCTRRKF